MSYFKIVIFVAVFFVCGPPAVSGKWQDNVSTNLDLQTACKSLVDRALSVKLRRIYEKRNKEYEKLISLPRKLLENSKLVLGVELHQNTKRFTLTFFTGSFQYDQFEVVKMTFTLQNHTDNIQDDLVHFDLTVNGKEHNTTKLPKFFQSHPKFMIAFEFEDTKMIVKCDGESVVTDFDLKEYEDLRFISYDGDILDINEISYHSNGKKNNQ